MFATAGLVAFAATQSMPLISSSTMASPPAHGLAGVGAGDGDGVGVGFITARTLCNVTPLATPYEFSPETGEFPPMIEATSVPCPLQSKPSAPLPSDSGGVFGLLSSSTLSTATEAR